MAAITPKRRNLKSLQTLEGVKAKLAEIIDRLDRGQVDDRLEMQCLDIARKGLGDLGRILTAEAELAEGVELAKKAEQLEQLLNRTMTNEHDPPFLAPEMPAPWSDA